ncbi:MAG: sigma-54-dependent Fis family transcriptional regulator [Candidatus Omnitrophica bacterium]|nr:sigma-54-dependent Fis family transcriptional regulator [Candidatus Omnitrophota bacterium]
MDKKRLMIIDDEASILEVVGRFLTQEGHEVAAFTDAKTAISDLADFRPNLVITDLRMTDLNGIDVIKAVKNFDPEINVIIMTAYASVDSAVEAIRYGASDYVIKPFKFEALELSIQRALSETRFIPLAKKTGSALPEKYNVRNLIGSSKEMLKVYDLIQKSAKTSSTVLVTGESGTGKELVARAIHYNSKRKAGNFVGINCAALPENLLESELFGHEKGSFTGAVATKAGLLELAHQGTFFMDEAAEITLPIQVKLLRVLQEKVVKRVGGLKDIPVDVRIIAATSRDLLLAVKEGRFRQELFYRLNVIPIHLPPLRQRKDDIPKLVGHFISSFSKQMNLGKKIAIQDGAVEKLKEYDWPGNVRELENVIERILALLENEVIGTKEVDEALHREMNVKEQPPAIAAHDPYSLRSSVDDYEKKIIEEALKTNNGNRVRTARQLGLTRQNLQYKLKKYGWV